MGSLRVRRAVINDYDCTQKALSFPHCQMSTALGLTMVSAEETAADENVCANCGIAGVDNVRLEECEGCDLVKYCSTKCREDHRDHHKEECKKRADKLHDKRLFTQPDGTHLGECPLCFLPMPLDPTNTFMSCCGQTICDGCCYANLKSNN